MRWGLGPVFVYECLTHSRRWQMYALRSMGVALLLLAMGLPATSGMPAATSSPREYAELGEAYFAAMIGVELALVMLIAPATTAGAICLDRARGTLAHVLMTDLSDPEIVLGKLAARLLPVFGLVGCTWPVMAISSLLGGIDPIALTLAFAIILAVAILGCTIALALSVWAHRSHEVVIVTYLVFIAGLLLWPVWYLLSLTQVVSGPSPWLLLANPFYVAFAPYTDPGDLDLLHYLIFFGGALGASAFFTILAVARTRPVACRGSSARTRGTRMGGIGRLTRWLPGPSLDRNPVFWREWHRSRPSRMMTAALAALMGTTGVLCLTGAAAFWIRGADLGPESYWEAAGVCSYVLHVIFGLMLLAAVAPMSMSEERQRGSLDILAATALSTREIVVGKWLGTFRLALLIALAPGFFALAMATASFEDPQSTIPIGQPPESYRVIPTGVRCFGAAVVVATIVAHGALIASIGLALAVWSKRQGQAIAGSIGAFVTITAAWPVVALIIINDAHQLESKVATLSPAVTCSVFVQYLTSRLYAYVNPLLASSTFWAGEVFTVALGLLWLTIRTFDHCFDRMPDRPRNTSIGTILVMISAAMIGVASLVGAVDVWVSGVRLETSIPVSLFLNSIAFSLLMTVALILVAIETALSALPAGTDRTAVTEATAARRFLVRRWWASLRLVLLLALGPAIFALALATARLVPHYELSLITDPSGGPDLKSYVAVWSGRGYPDEIPLSERLMMAAVLVVTILVHGAAAIGVSLILATAWRWSRRGLLIACGVALPVTLIFSTYMAVANRRGDASSAITWNFAIAMHSLLKPLMARGRVWTTLGEAVWRVAAWDVVIAVFALATFGLSVWNQRASSSRRRDGETVAEVRSPKITR